MANCEEEQNTGTGLSNQIIKQQLKFNIEKCKIMQMKRNFLTLHINQEL